MFSCKDVFLFLILISSPMHWWCSSGVFSPLSCVLHITWSLQARQRNGEKILYVCAEPWMCVMVLWSCCSQEWVQGTPEEFLQWEWMSDQSGCVCLTMGMFTQHKALLGAALTHAPATPQEPRAPFPFGLCDEDRDDSWIQQR